VVHRFAVVLIVLIGSRAAGQPLTSQELAQAIVLGQRCQAPIIRLSGSRADLDVYVKSPFAGIALVAAAARVAHQPLDAPGVKRAMRPGYRIWFARKPEALFPAAITHVTVKRLFLGTVPSHGIIEALARFPEFVFDRLPPDTFVVVVGTSRRTRRFAVTRRDRMASIRVCN
jgi:hypothetical protein